MSCLTGLIERNVMRILRMNISFPGRRAALCFGLLAWVGLSASIGRAAPANDPFVRAWTITGSVGTTNGSNVGAGFETGEPEIFPGISADETVWYKWTAPVDGLYSFGTAGSDFDSDRKQRWRGL